MRMHAPGLRARLVRAALVAVLSGARLAAAQASDEAVAATRQGLLRDAQRARRHGNHAEAVDLARRALRLSASVSLRRFLAEELDAVGEYPEALGAAVLCVREANASSSSADRGHREPCSRLADALEMRVARVTVRVPSPAPAGLTVRVGNAVLPEAVWGAPYVVVPGTLTLHAEAPDRLPFDRQLSLAPGQLAELVVALERPAPVAAPAPTPPPVRVATPPAVDRSAGRAAAAGPWVLVGAGVIVAAMAPVALYLRDREIDAIRARYGCDGWTVVCSVARPPEWDRAVVDQSLGIAAGVVGGALAVGGVVWFAVSRPRGAPTVTGSFSPGSGTLLVGGSF